MTPQQRHIKAHEILATIVPFSEWCPRWQEAVNELALALRRAANEAAWDGYRTKRDIIGAAKMTEKYGPKEARDE